MRKVTKDYEVYKFDELSKEVQKKVIEKERTFKYQYGDHVVEDITEYTKEQLMEKGIDLEPQWSHSSSQGDGLAFYGKIDWETQLLVKPTPGQYDLFKKVDLSVEIIRTSNHYNHYNTMKVETLVSESEMGWDKDDETVYKLNCKLVKDFEDSLLEQIQETSKTIFRQLVKHYDSYFTDEAIIDDLKNDEDAEYLANGERFYE